MTEQQKELLLTDISARLRYGVKCSYYDKCVDEQDEGTITGMQNGTYFVIDGVCIDVENVRPYLFPISSMTEEQMNELEELCDIYSPDDDYRPYAYLGIKVLYKHVLDDGYKFNFKRNVIDWFNKKHLDYRGLIEMGLADDATGKNIY